MCQSPYKFVYHSYNLIFSSPLHYSWTDLVTSPWMRRQIYKSAQGLQCKCLLILIEDFLNITCILTLKFTEAVSLTISQNKILISQTSISAVFTYCILKIIATILGYICKQVPSFWLWLYFHHLYNPTDFKRTADDSQPGKREIKTHTDNERQSLPPKLNPFLNIVKAF